MLKWFVSILILGFAGVPAHSQFWSITEGPPAATSCLASNSKGWVYAGTESSAVYRTKDLGATWERLDKGLDDGFSNFFTISTLNVGVNDEIFATGNGRGLFRTRDDGETWQKMDIKIDVAPSSNVTASIKVVEGATKVFIGYDAGPSALWMRMSTDGGDTFVEVLKGNLPSATSSLYETFLSPNSDKIFVLVAYNKGLYRSTNNGERWTRIDSDPSSGESDDNFLTMRADSKGRLFIGRNALQTSTKSPNAVVMRSTNDGESWSYLLDGWDNRDITNNSVTGIAFGFGDDVYAATSKTSGTFYSSNGGDSWISRNDGMEGDGSARGVVVTNRNHVFVAPSGAFVHKHIDPSTSVTNEIQSTPMHYVSPMPATSLAGVTVSTEGYAPLKLEVYNSMGAVVYTDDQIASGAGLHRFALNVSNFSNGLHTYRLWIGSQPVFGKFIVSHD